MLSANSLKILANNTAGAGMHLERDDSNILNAGLVIRT